MVRARISIMAFTLSPTLPLPLILTLALLLIMRVCRAKLGKDRWDLEDEGFEAGAEG